MDRPNVAPPPPRTTAPSRSSTTTTATNSSNQSSSNLTPAPPPLPATNSKADYNVVSSAHGAQSRAVTAAPPQALHDVDLYTSLAKDLPHDAAVLQSVLYTHRSVVNPDPSPDDVLQRLDEDIGKWKTDAKETASKSLELELVQHRAELADQQKDLMRRDVEHNRALRRMEDIIMNLERRIESDLSSDTGIGSITSQNNDTWIEMSARHKQQREQVAAMWNKKLQQAKERDFATQEMERLAHQGKTMIEEAASRAMLRNDEETMRLSLHVVYGNETVRALLANDAVNSRRSVDAEEATMRARLHEACSEELRRVQRRIGTKEAIGMLLHHTDSSEKGMRFNVTLEEQREWQDLLAQLGKSLLAADVATFAVSTRWDEL